MTKRRFRKLQVTFSVRQGDIRSGLKSREIRSKTFKALISKKIYALKKFQVDPDIVCENDKEDYLKYFLSEGVIHSELNHPNIVKYIERLEIDGAPCIVMEYAEGKDFDLINGRRHSQRDNKEEKSELRRCH